MATISTYTIPEIQGVGHDQTRLIVSEAAGPTDDVQLEGLPYWMPHCFMSVKMYDAMGAEITDSTVVFTITVRTKNNSQFETIDDGPTITGATPTTSSWSANTEAVNVEVTTPATETVTWRVFLTMNLM